MAPEQIIRALNNKMTCSAIIASFKKERSPRHIKTVKQFRKLIIPAYVEQYGPNYKRPQHLINDIKKLNKRLPRIFFFMAKHYDAFSKSGYGLTFRNSPGKKHFEGLAGGYPRANKLIKLMKSLGIIRIKLPYRAKVHSNVYISGYYQIKGRLWTSPLKLYHAQKAYGQSTSKWVEQRLKSEPTESMRQKLEPLYKNNAWSFCYIEEKEDYYKHQDNLLVRRANYHKLKKLKSETKSLHLTYVKDKPLYRAGFRLSNGKEEIHIYETSISLYGVPLKLSDPKIKPDLVSIITQCGKQAKLGKLDIQLTSSYYYHNYTMKYMEQRDPILKSEDDFMENGKTIEENEEDQRLDTWNEFFKEEIEKEEKEFENRLKTWDEFFDD